MITFLYGASGSGKSDYIMNLMKTDAERGIHSYLIVPEQQTVLRESEAAKLLPLSAQMTMEVLNFTRLANKVFRKFGGLSHNYITKSARSLIMWRALISSIPHLTEYADAAARDRGCVNMMLSAVNEFKAYRITPAMLGEAAAIIAEDGGEGERLSGRLDDLSLIYAAYEHSLSASYGDVTDDLDALADKLNTNDFFSGCNVYLDSFYGYTPQEINIISKIFAQAANVHVSFCCRGRSGDEAHFEFVRETASKLHRTAAMMGITPEIVTLTENVRHSGEVMRTLECDLWDFASKPSSVDPDGAISVIRAADNYDASEAAALDILRAVRGGMKFADIAVVVRGTDTYKGILDTAFEKFGIPCYISSRTDITSKPEVKHILSALAVCASSWRRDDVIGYIKTGFSGISNEESDIFERYAQTWGINGKRFTESGVWYMNPEGYSETITDKNAEILKSINATREKLTAPLVKLSAAFRAESRPTADICRAVFEFLTETNLRAQISSRAEKLSENGAKTEAAESVQLWNIICDTLDLLVDALPDAEIKNADQFAQLMKYIFDATDIGTIPTGTDEVTIGDASMLRLSEPKHVIILGANEGEFPQSVRDDGIFSDTDKIRLEGAGIVLSSDSVKRNAEELFWFYRAVCCPSESVTVITSESETGAGGKSKRAPSMGVSRICHLFPKLRVTNFSAADIADRLATAAASYEYLPATEGTKLGKSLRAALMAAENIPQTGKISNIGGIGLGADASALALILSAAEIPLTQNHVALNPETAGKLFGGDLAMTQSRLESFALCRFKYYCRYVLKLGEDTRPGFTAVNIGNFVHRILERFTVRIIGDDGRVRTDMTEDEIAQLADEVIREYIEEVCYGELDKSNRLTHLFMRLRRNVLVFVRSLIEEFSQSDFVPAFFELQITNSNPDSPPPISFPLPDGTDMQIYGVADRVDTYKKDGNVYIRVVDYKTGTKDFSLSDIASGLNLQLLLYLFAIWKCPTGNFTEKLNSIAENQAANENDGILPAGILYFSAKSPEVSIDSPLADEGDLDALVSKKMARKGLLLDDPDILTAMEKNLGGMYIPVKASSGGALRKSNSLASLEKFGSIFTDVSKTIERIGGEMKKGRADADPFETKAESPCQYCSMKPVCRRTGNA